MRSAVSIQLSLPIFDMTRHPSPANTQPAPGKATGATRNGNDDPVRRTGITWDPARLQSPLSMLSLRSIMNLFISRQAMSRFTAECVTPNRWQLFLFILVLVAVAINAQGQTEHHGTIERAPGIGIDANYALDMASRDRRWIHDSRSIDPFELLANNGCEHARIRLWVGDEGMNRLEYATQTALRVKRAGLKPYLVIFLSEEWSDFVKQPAPVAWRKMGLQEKAQAVRAYSERVTRHMSEQGVDIDTFEIGNEIDFGICGEFEEQWFRRVSLEYMRTQVWPRMATIIKAAQTGVLNAQPKARFILHLTQWNNTEYCIAFWRTMLAAGVRVDIPGLSYFPSNEKEPADRSFVQLQARIETIYEALRKPILICETGYPALAEFGGQFADWNRAADGYPLTAEGQARWLADLTKLIRNDRKYAGVFYWSPEWYDGGIWDAFALFDAQGVARPSVRSMAR